MDEITSAIVRFAYIIGSLVTTIIWKETFLAKILILPKYGELVTYNVVGRQVYKVNDAALMKQIFSKVIDRFLIVTTLFGTNEPGFGSINENKKWEHRRKKFMQSLALILNKLCIVYNFFLHDIYVYICASFFRRVPKTCKKS